MNFIVVNFMYKLINITGYTVKNLVIHHVNLYTYLRDVVYFEVRSIENIYVEYPGIYSSIRLLLEMYSFVQTYFHSDYTSSKVINY